MKKETLKERRKANLKVLGETWLSFLFLLSLVLFTFFWIKDYYILADSLSESLYHIFVYTGGAYALLKMGKWI